MRAHLVTQARKTSFQDLALDVPRKELVGEFENTILDVCADQKVAERLGGPRVAQVKEGRWRGTGGPRWVVGLVLCLVRRLCVFCFLCPFSVIIGSDVPSDWDSFYFLLLLAHGRIVFYNEKTSRSLG